MINNNNDLLSKRVLFNNITQKTQEISWSPKSPVKKQIKTNNSTFAAIPSANSLLRSSIDNTKVSPPLILAAEKNMIELGKIIQRNFSAR